MSDDADALLASAALSGYRIILEPGDGPGRGAVIFTEWTEVPAGFIQQLTALVADHTSTS
jgi:hypothetical protein